MEQLDRPVAEWRTSILDKGLNVNAGKFKVMVGSSGRKMIVNSGKWHSGVCGKGVQANSVQCTVCKKWVHKWCIAVRGNWLLVADSFRCSKRCDGTIQEGDLVEDLVVDGERYGCVKRFCYLSDTLDGADLAATARIKNGWMKLREILPFLTSRSRRNSRHIPVRKQFYNIPWSERSYSTCKVGMQFHDKPSGYGHVMRTG